MFIQKALESSFLLIQYLFTLCQETESKYFRPQNAPQHPIGVLKRQSVHALERHEHHREFAHIRLAQRCFLGDRQTVKQRSVRTNLKKGFQHAHIQRFAKAAWAREKVDLAPAVQQIADQSGLIHIIESLFADLLEILNADRQLFAFHAPASLRQAVHALSISI